MIFKHSRKRIVVLTILLISSILVESVALGYVENVKREQKKQDAYIYGRSIANAIQLTLKNTTDATEALKYFYLTYGEDCFDEFEEFASEIVKDNPSIGGLFIAPDGIIKVAYPMEKTATTLGFNMLEDEEQGPRARLAKTSGKITVAGPHDLIEGGVGFIIRNPIYIDGEFKGFTIIVLNWDEYAQDMLENVDSGTETYKYAVWKENYDETAVTDDDGFILRNSTAEISDEIDIEFEVPNDIWHLNVEPVDGWSVMDNMWVEIITSLVVLAMLIILFVALYMLWERKRLFEIERTENVTKGLYMTELTEAREKAERANEAKTVFLNNMSHDIRTPLNAILGFTRLMEKDINDPEAIRDYIKKIETSGNYLLTIINNVLDIARIDSGKMDLDEEFIDIENDDEQIFDVIDAERRKKQIELIHSMDIQHPYVWADKQKTQQIIINLLSNAIKYTPEKGTIWLETTELPCDEEGYGIYRTIVRDNGVGMSKEYQEKLFDAFTREKNSTESRVIGTGLGMAIVKKLIELMGGTIEVESELGKGTTFTYILKYKLVDDPETMIKNRESRQSETVDMQGKRILLAEDNELNAEIAMAILEDVGFEVEHAADGVQCFSMLSEAEAGYYNLVLMDIQMPNMDGYDATKKIRVMSEEGKKDIPIIAMTANAFEEDKKHALEVGMNGHVSKPIDVEKLMEVLVNILENE